MSEDGFCLLHFLSLTIDFVSHIMSSIMNDSW